MNYDWLKSVAEISYDHTSVTFNRKFNEIIRRNSLPENLTTITFSGKLFLLIISLNFLLNVTEV